MRTVNLVSSVYRLQQDFGRTGSAIASADYPIDPAACKTKLGQYIAENILTTRFDDDGSLLLLGLSQTNGDLHMKERLGEKAGETVAAEIRRLQAAIEHLEKYGEAYNLDLTWNKHATALFRFPLYGVEHENPEAYFDFCAKTIRKMDAVPLAAGLRQVPPSHSVARTCARNIGDRILDAYWAAKNPPG